jgi:hypothetical protein
MNESPMRKLARFSATAIVCVLGIRCTRVSYGLDAVTEGCVAGRGDDCWQQGEYALRKAAESVDPDWGRPVDRARARAAYERGCELNAVRACAALLERHLLDDKPKEREAMIARLQALGVAARTDAQVAAEDEALVTVVKADLQHWEKAKREDLARQMAQLGQLQITGAPGHMQLVTAEQAQTAAQLQAQVGQAPGDAEIAKMKKDVNAIVAAADKNAAQKSAAQHAGHPAPAGPLPGAPPKPTSPTSPTGQTPAQVAAAQKQKNLDECLAQPATRATTVQTNPFQVYVTAYQGRLDRAGQCAATPSKAWSDCIGGAAADLPLWPDQRAQNDENDFVRRFNAVVSFMPPGGHGACLYNQTLGDTRTHCLTIGKDACVLRLQQNVADMQCALATLPRVWDGENARNDTDAKTRQAADCHRKWD